MGARSPPRALRALARHLRARRSNRHPLFQSAWRHPCRNHGGIPAAVPSTKERRPPPTRARPRLALRATRFQRDEERIPARAPSWRNKVRRREPRRHCRLILGRARTDRKPGRLLSARGRPDRRPGRPFPPSGRCNRSPDPRPVIPNTRNPHRGRKSRSALATSHKTPPRGEGRTRCAAFPGALPLPWRPAKALQRRQAPGRVLPQDRPRDPAKTNHANIDREPSRAHRRDRIKPHSPSEIWYGPYQNSVCQPYRILIRLPLRPYQNLVHPSLLLDPEDFF